MEKREELDLFLTRAVEFIDSKYILADVKIANLLKSVATSETLLALFKNCLTDFDYEDAQKKYLVKSTFAEGKGEFILPQNSREMLAFIFNVLVDIDAKNIDFSEFLDKYFYVDGSSYSGYASFINAMVKPFVNSVKIIMESVIEGKLQDPVEAFIEEEKKRLQEEEEKRLKIEKEKALAKKSFGASIKKLKTLLSEDKSKISTSKLKESEKKDINLVIDMLVSALDSNDKESIEYAFVAYKYVVKSHFILLNGRIKKTALLIEEIVREL